MFSGIEAPVLVHDRQHARIAAADAHRLARARPPARVRAGWLLVGAGLRLATPRHLRMVPAERACVIDRSVAVLSWVRC